MTYTKNLPPFLKADCSKPPGLPTNVEKNTKISPFAHSNSKLVEIKKK